MPQVLIVQDNEAGRQELERLVAAEGHSVEAVATLADARGALSELRPQVVFCAVKLPDGEGVDLLRDLEDDTDVEIVLVASRPTVESAISAVRLGALDYLTIPIDVGELRRVLAAAVEGGAAGHVVGAVPPEKTTSLGDMITASPMMRRVFNRIERVAPTDVTVLIVGASGTGKELAARAVHDLSSRRGGPFLAVNCGAVAPSVIESELFGHERGSFTGADRRHVGYFERASEGTLLLDEITEMSDDLQVKLLRVLETGKVLRVGATRPVKASPRIVASTNRNPENEVAAGRLREDLFYRLKVFTIRMPGLSDRGPHEVALLAEHFLDQLNRGDGTAKVLAPEALGLLKRYRWPGNIRELRNVMTAASVLAEDTIGVDCLPPEILQPFTPENDDAGPEVRVEVGSTIADAEKQLILKTLDHLDGDKPEAAKTLGISLKTLYNRLKEYRRKRRT